MRPMIAITLVCAAALGLAGCAPEDHTLSPSPSPSAPATLAPGEGTLPPEPANETIGINCTALISDQVVYDWGSGNFALEAGFTPEAGSSAAQMADEGGLACRWINLTSQETVDVAVSIPTDGTLAAARDAAATAGSAAPELGDAFIHVAEGVGYVDVFSGGYWLNLKSTWFSEPGDAKPLVEAAVAALPARG